MGSSSGKPPFPSTLKSITDARYGGRIMIDNNQTRAYQIVDVDENNVENFTHLMNQRKQLRHPALISANRTWVEEYREGCSLQKMYRITIQYMYISTSLQDEISKYCQLRRPVPQYLIRKYFSDVVSCLDYLKSRGTCHGDIKPKTILISPNGRAFLADSYFIHGGKISYQIVMQDPQSLSLLSPAQLQSLRNKKFVSLQQVYEDEMFEIGLCMIEAMTAEPAMQCYDLANLKLKPQFFNRKYSEMLSCGYSPQLCQLVMKCVQPISQRRVKFPQFLAIINSAGDPNFSSAKNNYNIPA